MQDDLLRELEPVIAAFEGIDLTDGPRAAAQIEQRVPFTSDAVARIRTAAEAGYEAGWLTPHENGPLRYGRVTKDFHGYSVDAVCMSTPGPKHRHPNGEISLCFARDGDPKFDGHGEGWVVLPPGSAHVPTVAGGTMLILYFLPEGAMEWLER